MTDVSAQARHVVRMRWARRSSAIMAIGGNFLCKATLLRSGFDRFLSDQAIPADGRSPLPEPWIIRGRWYQEMDRHVSRDKEKSEKMETHRPADVNPARPPDAVEGGLEGDVQAHLGRQLRAVYDEVANEPVPDRFLKLIEELERKSALHKPQGEA